MRAPIPFFLHPEDGSQENMEKKRAKGFHQATPEEEIPYAS